MPARQALTMPARARTLMRGAALILGRRIGMGFIEDIWTAILSDDPDELETAVERISE